MIAITLHRRIAVLGRYYVDDQRRQPVVSDPITLHGDDARCVYGPARMLQLTGLQAAVGKVESAELS